MSKTITLQGLYDNQQAMQANIMAEFKAVHEDVDTLKASQKGLHDKLDDLTTYTEAGFDTMNGRFDRAEDRMDRFEEQMNRFEGRMDGFEGRMDRFETILASPTRQS